MRTGLIAIVAVSLGLHSLEARGEPAAAGAAAVFRPGEVWLDTDGKPIQAHSAGILLRNGVYYWYGEDKTLGNFNKTGVSCYSSRDLHAWKREGVVLPKEKMPEAFRDTGVCERPKVLYCPKTRKYVMWMHLDDASYAVASAGVTVADAPTGPFQFLRYFRPIRHAFDKEDRCKQKERGSTYRDMNLFADDDGKAYAFYAAEDNATMYVVRLSDDFTDAQQPPVEGKTWSRNFVGKSREAPAPFKHQGKYYLITSGCSGWKPNAADWAVADVPLGPWTMKGNPCVGPKAETTFDAQSTFVLPAPGKPAGCFLFLADRWNERKLEDSRYVWLPFRIREDGAVSIKYREEWDLSVFDK
jgi:hypothetical protein